MELDPPPPYFYDPFEAQGEDFHRSSAPSEDIWKKFELLPSPPASPLPGPAEDAAADGPPEPAAGLLGNLSAFVLRDCMWSGFSARERLEKAMGEKLAAKPTPALAPAHDFGGLGGECVAPGAVFAWPGGSEAAAAPADTKIPVSSGSESQSDSEGEEIDVVTVEKRQALGTRKPVTITVRDDPLDPCTKHFHIAIHQQQHNYAARSPPEAHSIEGPLEKGSPDAGDNEPQSPGQGVERFPPAASLPKAGSAPGSDSEDVTKRKNHNYLERKRRNDLRSRFLALRDQVPGLASCPKTPKVVVLSKASEYLQLLLSAEQQMVAEKKLLKLHQLQLRKQISHLQGTE
ncbi:protein L-Myc [Pantherophis guttatus]|uniref:Protein L-Myc n=1 Tax=Pantherophis guttatus TaxID=94885 RepID=A0A6P9BGF6_PANGU|nr:protein L-Myc [Pantherophis guttatus]